jgi:hypothetical protein
MTMLDPHLDVDQLSAAVDGDQDAAASAHLLACLSCREQVRAWQQSLGQLKDLAEVTSPVPAGEAVEVAMAQWRPPVRVGRWRHIGPIAAAVAAVILVAGGIVVLGRHAGNGAGSTSAGMASRPAHTVPRATGASGVSGEKGVPGAGASGTSAGKATFGTGKAARERSEAPLVAADRAALAADLRSDVRSGSVPARVPASTPCLAAARAIAAKSLASTSAAAAFEESVHFKGIVGRVFLFRGAVGSGRASHNGGGYVAFVVRDKSCSLVTSLNV